MASRRKKIRRNLKSFQKKVRSSARKQKTIITLILPVRTNYDFCSRLYSLAVALNLRQTENLSCLSEAVERLVERDKCSILFGSIQYLDIVRLLKHCLMELMIYLNITQHIIHIGFSQNSCRKRLTIHIIKMCIIGTSCHACKITYR